VISIRPLTLASYLPRAQEQNNWPPSPGKVGTQGNRTWSDGSTPGKSCQLNRSLQHLLVRWFCSASAAETSVRRYWAKA
jgi:hypothetical protein